MQVSRAGIIFFCSCAARRRGPVRTRNKLHMVMISNVKIYEWSVMHSQIPAIGLT